MNRGLHRSGGAAQEKEQSNGYQTNGKSMEPVKVGIEGNKKAKREPGVFGTVAKAYGWSYIYGFLLRTVTDLMMFISPLILKYANYISLKFT